MGSLLTDWGLGSRGSNGLEGETSALGATPPGTRSSLFEEA